MKNTKPHKVVMLPTEKASPLLISEEIDTENQLIFAKNYGFDLFDHNKNFRHTNKQHLYIISDDEIKEGDWFIDLDRNTKHKSSFPDGLPPFLKRRCKKIVATTDSLYFGEYNEKLKRATYGLCQIPESFLTAYIKAYNEGKPITEVDLETVEVMDSKTEVYGTSYSNRRTILKTRTDNTVIVRESKTYSLEDIRKAYKAGFYMDPIHGLLGSQDGHVDERFDKWIQDNL